MADDSARHGPLQHPSRPVRKVTFAEAARNLEEKYNEAVAKLLRQYEEAVLSATGTYERQMDESIRIWKAIVDPARRIYESRVKVGDSAQRAISGPAEAEFKLEADLARTIFDDSLAPLKAAFEADMRSLRLKVSSDPNAPLGL